jgi:phosphate uptake regulator
MITLPKDWARSYKIKKNDPLGVVVQPDGTLLITPETKREQLQRIKEFDITDVDEATYFFRLLIGAYISGYSIIKINSKKKMEPFQWEVVRNFIQMTVGQEVSEETENMVVIRDLLNPGEMPFDNTVKRMYMIVKGMHSDAINVLSNKDYMVARHTISRDNEVDKLHWLIERQYNLIFRNVDLLDKMGVTREWATNYYLTSRILERIGDHAVIIAKNTLYLEGKRLNKKIVNKIISASNLAMKILDNSVESLYKKKLKDVNDNIESVKKLEALCGEINALALQQKGIIAHSLGYIVESIRRIGEYAVNISENVINHVVGETALD